MTAIKTIETFRMKDYGLFIDLVRPSGHIGVDRETGNILLDEGAGEDRYHGAVIRAASFREFSLQKVDEHSWRLSLRYGEKGSHELGVTVDRESAESWIRSASQVIRSCQEHSNTSRGYIAQHPTAEKAQSSEQPKPTVVVSAPQLRRRVNIFSDSVHLVHPPVNYSQFQHRPELELLMDWMGKSRDRVCIISGIGGSGKTTLATHFLLSLCPGSIAGSHPTSNYFRRGFYYSFYADPKPKNFLHSLWRWLKPDSKQMPMSRLKWFHSLQEVSHCLLVLDGFEVISSQAMSAKISGLSLDELLGGIAAGRTGSARWLITSRPEKFFDEELSKMVIPLAPLSENASLSLLRSRGVEGDEKVLRKLVRVCGHHPLTLDLAGHCLREFGWDETWNSLLSRKGAWSDNSSLDIIGTKFFDRLTTASPETAGFLASAVFDHGDNHRASIYAVPAEWPVMNTVDTTKFTWGLDLLKRSGIVVLYTQHHGKIGHAEGGVANYQFEPEKEQPQAPRTKVFVQPNKIGEMFSAFVRKKSGNKKLTSDKEVDIKK